MTRSALQPQPVQLTVSADTSALERKVDELSAKVDSLLALLQGQAQPAASYTPADAAKLLQVDRKRIYELLAQRQIRAIKVGSSWRIPASALDDFLAGRDIPQQIPERRILPLRRGGA